MKSHELKSWPENFQPVVAGLKTCELRFNDRNYQVGDIIHLKEWIPDGREMHDAKGIRLSVGEYSGDWLRLIITHITNVAPVINLPGNNLTGWVVLSFNIWNQIK